MGMGQKQLEDEDNLNQSCSFTLTALDKPELKPYWKGSQPVVLYQEFCSLLIIVGLQVGSD